MLTSILISLSHMTTICWLTHYGVISLGRNSRLFQASFGLRLDFLSEGTGQHIVVLLAFSNLWTKRLLLLLLSLCIIYVC